MQPQAVNKEILIGNQHHYYWKNTSNNRYYLAILQKDLLHDWILFTCYGRKGTRLGRLKHHVCQTENEGLQLINKLSKVRSKHGYKLRSEKLPHGQ